MERQQEILEFTLEAGRVLLANGGEIFRVQETMQRIAASYGAQEFHVYVLTNGLFASLKGNGETFSGEVRSVNVTNIHLKRIVAVNELSRAIERGGVPLDEAFRSLRAIEKMPGWPSWLRVLACGVGAAGFAYLYGGTPLDALAAPAGRGVQHRQGDHRRHHPAGAGHCADERRARHCGVRLSIRHHPRH